LKKILRFLIAFLLISLFSACAGKNKIYQGICKGVYDASNQEEKIENFDAGSPEKKSLNYEQYKREKGEILIINECPL